MIPLPLRKLVRLHMQSPISEILRCKNWRNFSVIVAFLFCISAPYPLTICTSADYRLMKMIKDKDQNLTTKADNISNLEIKKKHKD